MNILVPLRGTIKSRITATIVFGLLLLEFPTLVHADVMVVTYEGLINTSGFSSSGFFRDRPETRIVGSFTYDSDTPAIPRVSGVGFALIDYSFVIHFPDRADYVSTGITDFGLGNITVPSSPPRVDFLVQGVFEGPDLGLGFAPTGSTFQLQDGSSSLNIPANTLVADTLPDTSFTLDDVTGGSMFLEWTNALGGRMLAHFQLTSLTVAPAAPPSSLPEPGSVLLIATGIVMLGLYRRTSSE